LTVARRVWVATGNRGKVDEIRAIFAHHPFRHPVECLAASDSGPVRYPEEGDDYRENALAKARAAAGQLGGWAVADDSGLEVDALDGAPGPRSARYGGPGLDDAGRIAHLLEALRGVPPARRAARFVCWAAWASSEGESGAVLGTCAGTILEAPRGRGGFGYDPIFQVEGRRETMAELRAEEKNRISHRARAFAALARELDRALGRS